MGWLLAGKKGNTVKRVNNSEINSVCPNVCQRWHIVKSWQSVLLFISFFLCENLLGQKKTSAISGDYSLGHYYAFLRVLLILPTLGLMCLFFGKTFRNRLPSVFYNTIHMSNYFSHRWWRLPVLLTPSSFTLLSHCNTSSCLPPCKLPMIEDSRLSAYLPARRGL